MFLKSLVRHNKKFINAVFSLANQGLIAPNTYVIDLDTTYKNMQTIIKEANKENINLFFVPKHVGYNPYIAKKAIELGFKGVMPVDFEEASVMLKNNVKISHLGHLVQCPENMLKQFIKQGVGIITVYSLQKAQQINSIAKELGIVQDIMLKPIDIEKDTIYPQQEGGIAINEVEDFAKEVLKLSNVKINGVTSFPCFLFNPATKKVEATHNIKTVKKAQQILLNQGIKPKQINLPSVTCCSTLAQIKNNNGNYAEVGNGATGTTPLHALESNTQKEIPSMLYYSTISHSVNNKSYAYGGGYYSRSHLKYFLTPDYKMHKAIKPNDTSIDYHIGLDSKLSDDTKLISCFRTQIFTTRAKVLLVEGVLSGNINIKACYGPLGYKI